MSHGAESWRDAAWRTGAAPTSRPMLVRRAGALAGGPGSGFEMRVATGPGAIVAGDADRMVSGTSAAGAEVGVPCARTSQPPTSQPPMSRAPIIAAAAPILAARPMRPCCGGAETLGGLAMGAAAATAGATGMDKPSTPSRSGRSTRSPGSLRIEAASSSEP